MRRDNMLHVLRRILLTCTNAKLPSCIGTPESDAATVTADYAALIRPTGSDGSWRPSVLVFPEIELPHPHPQKDKAYPAHDELPVSVRLVDRVHPEAHHRGSEKDDTDNLIWFHVSAELLPA
jgi:hypothetical protein